MYKIKKHIFFFNKIGPQTKKKMKIRACDEASIYIYIYILMVMRLVYIYIYILMVINSKCYSS